MVNTDIKEKVKINSLQVVRALAFLGVFLEDCGAIHLGAWGVSVFLILSGFLMTYRYYNRTLESSLINNWSFSIKKMSKLYPLHILMMIAALLFEVRSLIYNFSEKSLLLTSRNVFLNITLLQSWVPQSSVYFSLNGLSWYLSTCFFIYTMFPVILKYIKKMNLKSVITTMVIIYLIQIFGGYVSQFANLPTYISDNFPYWLTYVSPIFRVGDFFIGCCTGVIFLQNKLTINKYVATLLETVTIFLIVIAVLICSYQLSFLGEVWFKDNMLFTPSSVFLIFLFAINKGYISRLLTCKPLIYIGNISAYAFLIRQISNRYIYVFFDRLFGITLTPWELGFASLILTIIAVEVYKRIDTVFKNRRKNYA